MNPQQVPTVTLDELPQELPEGTALLDVREHDEWNAGHAPTATHIPMGELAGRLEEVPEADEVYVVCRSGGRSARVTAFLNDNGWDAVNVDRGMNGWATEGRPMVSEDGSDPRVL